MRWLVLLLCPVVAVGFGGACASEDAEAGAAAAGTGGGSGGSSAADAASSGGAAGAAENDCVHKGPPLIDPKDLPVCPLCQNARCVSKGLVPADQVDLLADCEDGSKCVPDKYIETVGKFVLPSCTSLLGNEGRCVSTCLPDIAAQADRLPKDVCAEGELCAPCYDPTTGDSTGACTVSCDPGPTEAPTLYPECCNGLGSCVPESLVPADQKGQLGSDGCSTAGDVCAPKILAGGDKPAACASVDGAEGRCLPACLPAVAAQADKLPQDVCQTGELCAPCYDPLTAQATGSCSINGDAPNGPPTSFDACCNGAGACVPKALVPADQQSMLGADTCADPGTLCVPTELANSGAKPASCVSLGGAEGRCMAACLPAIAAQAGKLPQSSCPATHKCAPCYDPLSGQPTGSCSVNGDAPTQPPLVFPKCCPHNGSARGTCVPVEALTKSQVDSLPKDSCPSDAWRCVPNLKVQDPNAKFPYCQASGIFGGSQPGACVPDCLVGGFEGIFVGQGSCKSGEKCAPCTKPFGGSSGACD